MNRRRFLGLVTTAAAMPLLTSRTIVSVQSATIHNGANL